MPFSIERNDLASMHVDAIVVAANENLQVTGGVGMAVAQAAGFERVQSACDEIGFCPTGSAVSTPGFDLPARTIVHAVGPVWHEGGSREKRLLASAYAQALQRAADADARSVALPLLSAGTYGCPAEISFSLAMEAVRAFLEQHDMDVRVVLYSRAAVAAGLALYGDIASYIDDRYVDEHAPYARQTAALGGEDGWRYGREMPRSPGQSIRAAQAPPAQSDDLRRGFLARLRERRKAEQRAGAAPAPREVAPGRAAASAPEPADASAPMAPASAFEVAGAAEEFAEPAYAPMAVADACEDALAAPSFTGRPSADLGDLLDAMDEPFSTTLLALIDARGLTDAQVYKRANLSRQHFSKIRSDASYRPTKKTALALAVALELDLDETDDLLRRAGFALSNSSKADIIVEYFIVRGIYDIFAINEALYAFDQPLL